jgi:hypothetical protein
MLKESYINLIKSLYEKIFNENAIESEEFTIFVEGNPHPLRIKVENYIDNLNIKDGDHPSYVLDNLIMDYIENNL